jgi:hypothetical protein
MKKLFKFIPIFILTALLPMVTRAASSCNTTVGGLGDILCRISELMSALLPIIISLGVLYFVWGVVQFMIGDTEEAKTKGKDTILYGIIGLAVIVSIWGLVALLNQTFGVSGTDGLTGINAPNVTNLSTQVGTGTCTAITNRTTFAEVLGFFTCTIAKTIIPFIFALAVLMFIWGVVKFFLINGDEEKQREEGKQFILWGIISLAVMISIWGLVNILSNTFGISTSALPTVKP